MKNHLLRARLVDDLALFYCSCGSGWARVVPMESDIRVFREEVEEAWKVHCWAWRENDRREAMEDGAG